MIWTILLIIAALIVLVFFILAFTPFGVSFQFSNSSNKNNLNAFFFLFSGFFLRVEYDFTENSMIIRLFGLKIDFRKKGNSPDNRQDDRIGKEKKRRKGETETELKVERKTKDGLKTEEKKEAQSNKESVNDKVVVSSGISDINQSNSNQDTKLDQSSYTRGNSEASESQHQTEQKTDEKQAAQEPEPQESAQKKKKVRLIDTIDQIKSRINRHPAVFFLKQETLRYRVWRWIVRILKSILRIIVIRRLLVRAELVFDDPALGGKLFGYYEGVRHAAALYSKKINLYFKPLFIVGDTRIDMDFRATTSLWKIGYPLIVAVVTFPYITFGIAWWRFYRVNRQQKKADAKRN